MCAGRASDWPAVAACRQRAPSAPLPASLTPRVAKRTLATSTGACRYAVRAWPAAAPPSLRSCPWLQPLGLARATRQRHPERQPHPIIQRAHRLGLAPVARAVPLASSPTRAAANVSRWAWPRAQPQLWQRPTSVNRAGACTPAALIVMRLTRLALLWATRALPRRWLLVWAVRRARFPMAPVAVDRLGQVPT